MCVVPRNPGLIWVIGTADRARVSCACASALAAAARVTHLVPDRLMYHPPGLPTPDGFYDQQGLPACGESGQDDQGLPYPAHYTS